MCNDNFMFNRDPIKAVCHCCFSKLLIMIFVTNIEKEDRKYFQKIYNDGAKS
ncbi:MAG: hypothetical protein HeimC3_44360 [Candidatus Heimdallarchaeota archaeon LC_3]|nr:MAG: hypothetical protein HeimC3_44360 [Candidatus Heimdallarchaeota archaeon LC_3]